jgi:peptide deformylase
MATDSRPMYMGRARAAFTDALMCASTRDDTVLTLNRGPIISPAMAKLPLVYLPDPRLREVSKPFERVDDDVRRLVADMFETMEKNDGLGLAGVQVGVLRRIVVLDLLNGEEMENIGKGDERPSNPIAMINPKILTLGDGRRTHEEGCLSMPDVRVDIERPSTLTVQFLDRNGKTVTLEASGLLATAIQHEIDHLDGRLIIDFLSKLRRDMVIRRFKKLAKTGDIGD